MSSEKATAAIARLSGISKELDARRELRDRGAAAARAQASDSMKKMGPVAEKVAEHLGEMGRRQRAAGGWATEKTMGDRRRVFGFGNEDESVTEQAPAAAAPRPAPERVEEPPAPPRRPEPTRRADDDDDYSDTSSWLRD